MFAITQAMEPTGSPADQAMKDSYAAVIGVPLIDAENPKKSRLYTRLAVDGHNCFDGSCDVAAQEMLDAINNYLQDPNIQSQLTGGGTSLTGKVTSDSVNLLSDGIVASGSGRYENNQIAMYKFMLGSGDKVLDTSGIPPEMDLQLTGNTGEGVDYQWLPNWGVQFLTASAKAQATTAGSSKLATMIGSTGQYSIEAWVVPSNINQPDASIVTYTGGPSANNFSLVQNDDEYDMYNRSTALGVQDDGNPLLETTNSQLRATLQHVVVTYDRTHGRQIYINGVLDTTDTDPVTPGDLTNWESSFALVLGNDLSLKHSWKGAIRMLAIHDRALSQTQVQQNFDAGVGQSYYILFNVSQLLPNMGCTSSDGKDSYCFIVMKAAVFDQSSYIFSNPRFVDINDANLNFSNSLLIKGMRIGINGVEAKNGQAYQDINVCINGGNGGCGDANSIGASYSNTPGPQEGAQLSNVGTVIAMQNGPTGTGSAPGDMIFLTFEAIGSQTATSGLYDQSFPTSPTPPAVNPPANGDDIMIHSFAEINATLAAISGVASTNPSINNNSALGDANDGTYTQVIQALPSSHDASTFVSANQMGVTQLAIGYCDQLMRGNGDVLPSSYFPSFGFTGTNGNTPPATVDFTSATTRSEIIEPLLSHVMNVEYDGAGNPITVLANMPLESTVHGYLDTLIYDNSVTPATGLAASCASGPANCQPAETAVRRRSPGRRCC